MSFDQAFVSQRNCVRLAKIIVMTFFVYQPFRKANMWPKNFKRIKVQLLLANSMWLISYDFLRACFHTMPDFARKGNAFPAFIAISHEKIVWRLIFEENRFGA